jgi:hypothetical protein
VNRFPALKRWAKLGHLLRVDQRELLILRAWVLGSDYPDHLEPFGISDTVIEKDLNCIPLRPT